MSGRLRFYCSAHILETVSTLHHFFYFLYVITCFVTGNVLFKFVLGLGSVFTYMVALNTNIINFDKKHTGKVVGLLNAFFAGSPSVFATLYYHVFKDGDHHDYPGFLLMFAISFGIADLLCIIFLRIYAEKDGTKEPFQGITGPDKNSGTEENDNDFKYKQLVDPNTSVQESSGGKAYKATFSKKSN